MELFKFFFKGISISLIVKFSGLIRDALTFYFIGVSELFDDYVYYLTIPALITAFILPLINLWLVPILSNNKRIEPEGYINFFMVLSFFLALVNSAFSFFIAFTVKGFDESTLPLIITSSLVLVFTICSEVLASRIISEGENLQKMYFGNLFVNAPVVVYLLLPEPSVVGLAIVSSISFFIRFIYLYFYSNVNFLALLNVVHFFDVLRQVRTIELSTFKKMLLGPLFQCSVYIGRLFCVFLPVGALSVYFYSFKLFDAFKGTFLFVGLTKFFSTIQGLCLKKSLKAFKSFSYINFFVSIIYVFFLFLLNFLLSMLLLEQAWAQELNEIIELSYITVPLCFLYPTLVFYQRLIVTFDEVSFRFGFFMSVPLFVFLSIVFLYFVGVLSVNYIITVISVALLIPNLYIFVVFSKTQEVNKV